MTRSAPAPPRPTTPSPSRRSPHEQEFVDGVYHQLDRSTPERRRRWPREGHARARLGHEGGLVERDAMVFQAARRIATLDAAHEGLVFGRLDMRARSTEAPRYIGRIGLRDDNRDVLLIDWRAPGGGGVLPGDARRARGASYAAGCCAASASTVVGVEDDLLDAEADDDLPIVGEGALMAQLSRARDRSMHSIVATIQAEQDKAIRAPGQGRRDDRGRPGHRQDGGRAAPRGVPALRRPPPLRDRRRARGRARRASSCATSSGCCPSLGETAVALRSLGEVVDGVRATRRDDPAVAEVKGCGADGRAAPAYGAAGGARARPREFRFFYRDDVLLLGRRELAALRRQLLSQGQPQPAAAAGGLHADRRAVAPGPRRAGRRARSRGVRRHDARRPTRSSTSRAPGGRRSTPPTCSAGCATPSCSPGSPRACSSARSRRCCPRGRSAPQATTSAVEDVPLLDELRYLLGDAPEKPERGDRDDDLDPLSHLFDDERAGGDHGHRARVRRPGRRPADPHRGRLLRARARRRGAGPDADAVADGRPTWSHGDLDVVGDPAQSSWPVPAEAARARAEALGDKDPARLPPLHELPQQRGDLRLRRGVRRAGSGLDADLPNAVRETGVEPAERRSYRPAARGSARRWPSSPRRSRARSGSSYRSPGGPRCRRGSTAGPSSPRPRPAGPLARLAVLTGLDTKGLEFDGDRRGRAGRDRGGVARPAGRRSTWCSPGPPSGWSPSPPEPSRRERTSGWRVRAVAFAPTRRVRAVRARRLDGSVESRGMDALLDATAALDAMLGHAAWAAIRLRDSATVTLVGGSPQRGRAAGRRAARGGRPAGAAAGSTGCSRSRSARSPSAGSRRTTTAPRWPSSTSSWRSEVPLADLLAALPDEPIDLRATAAASSPPTRTTPPSSTRSSATRSATARAPTSWSAATTARRLARLGRPTRRSPCFRRLLERERGAYWTFCFFTGDRFLVGASPERHVIACTAATSG